MVVWMCVTEDKFELPIAIADTPKELSKLIKTDAKTISESYCRYKAGKKAHCRFRKVELEGGDNE